jgi:hypothetical protein
MSNQNNRIILNDILNYIKNIDNDIKLIKEVKQIKALLCYAACAAAALSNDVVFYQ